MSKGYSRRSFFKLSSGLLLGAVCGPAAAVARPDPAFRYVERSTYTMGSIVTIKAYASDTRECDAAIDAAFGAMKAVDRLMSVFDPASQVSHLNRGSIEEERAVDSRVIEVLAHADHFSRMTGGAFDITVEPLMELYGFRDERGSRPFPTDRQIAETLGAVGMKNVAYDRERSTVRFLHSSTKVDLGGIAVGYAVDQAVKVLKTRGIQSAIINHSGDLFAIGSPPDAEGWDIEIVNPLRDDELMTFVRIKDEALSTSGNYRQYIEAQGRTIGHILDPISGASASTILSGTVISATAIEADALSTGMFVLGVERSKDFFQPHSSARFIAIVRDGPGVSIVRS